MSLGTKDDVFNIILFDGWLAEFSLFSKFDDGFGHTNDYAESLLLVSVKHRSFFVPSSFPTDPPTCLEL